MHNERLELLFQKQVNKTISSGEQAELHDLMTDPGNEELTRALLRQHWTAFSPTPTNALSVSERKALYRKIWRTIAGKTARKTPIISRSLWWRSAAAVLLMVASVVAIYYTVADKKMQVNATTKINQVSTEQGAKTRLQLSDGTQVWLHANSRLHYNTASFGKANREVTLTGEAYFDVVKNIRVPFIIHTGQVNITVKGTAFNVKAYPTDKAVETTLIRGLIEIATVQDPDRKILLKPNEKILIPVNTAPNRKSTPEAAPPLFTITRLKTTSELPAEVSWIQEQLVFDDEPLSNIAPKMSSWYNIDIQFRDEEVKKKRFSGTIERETLKETLHAMQLSFPFEYEITNNVLYISSKH